MDNSQNSDPVSTSAPKMDEQVAIEVSNSASAAPLLDAPGSVAPPIPESGTAADPRHLRTASTGGRPASMRTNTMRAGIARQVSQTSLMHGGVRPTFYCQICMCNHSEEDAFLLSSCGHRFCNTCMSAFVEDKIKNASVYLRCVYDKSDETDAASGAPAPTLRNSMRVLSVRAPLPAPGAVEGAVVIPISLESDGGAGAGKSAAERGHASVPIIDNTCGVPISEDDVLLALANKPAEIERYQRFKAEQNNPNIRQCPYPNCTGSTTGRASEPLMHCTVCAREFCFAHANAHVGKTCETYERETLQENKLSEAAIAVDSKRCPKCGIAVQKSSGCNHMTCKCGQSFCWVCGQGIDGGILPTHYAWWNLRGCAGKQMSDGPTTTAGAIGHFLYSALMFLILGPVSVVLSVATFIICPCFCIPMCLKHEEGACSFFTFVTFMWMSLILMIIVGALLLPFAIVAGVFALLCLPCIMLFLAWVKMIAPRGG